MRREFLLPEETPSVVMIEDVAHPIERVWTARFEPLYVARWWHPFDYVNHIVELDLVEGTPWRIVQRDPDGRQFSFYGSIERVVPHESVVQTFISELFPHMQTRLKTDFQVNGEITRVITTHHLISDYVRDGYLRLGALERMTETSDNFELLLKELAKR